MTGPRGVAAALGYIETFRPARASGEGESMGDQAELSMIFTVTGTEAVLRILSGIRAALEERGGTTVVSRPPPPPAPSVPAPAPEAPPPAPIELPGVRPSPEVPPPAPQAPRGPAEAELLTDEIEALRQTLNLKIGVWEYLVRKYLGAEYEKAKDAVVLRAAQSEKLTALLAALRGLKRDVKTAVQG